MQSEVLKIHTRETKVLTCELSNRVLQRRPERKGEEHNDTTRGEAGAAAEIG